LLPALAVTAATASAAPIVDADRSCYSTYGDTPIHLTGAGFTPGGRLTDAATWIGSSGQHRPVGSYITTADSTGGLDTSGETPELEGPAEDFKLKLTVSDEAKIAFGAPPAEQSVETTVKVSVFGAWMKPWNTDGPAPGRPSRRDLLDVGGYLDANSRVLFVHDLRGRRLVKTLRVGRLRGACAVLTRRFREFNFRPVPAGMYRVLFDTTRAWPNDDKWSGYDRVVVRARDARPAQGPSMRDHSADVVRRAFANSATGRSSAAATDDLHPALRSGS
jgi:hypothetical protein